MESIINVHTYFLYYDESTHTDEYRSFVNKRQNVI